jgi:Holliday junction resolvase RusA-like endonuclease
MRLSRMIFLVAFMVIVLLSCTPPKKNRVVILKYATHPALDELEAAYFDRLSNLLKDDEKLKDYSIEKYSGDLRSTK